MLCKKWRAGAASCRSACPEKKRKAGSFEAIRPFCLSSYAAAICRNTVGRMPPFR